ncbi:MAG: aminoacyl-tRNA hydrolase [Firmicutes bacterium]|nr:aminoacyl-tRNA hydrolase [Bacillota bacterium]
MNTTSISQGREKMHLLVGLGNPGHKYGQTRHNVGFWVIDALSAAHGLRVDQRGFHSLWTQASVAGVKAILLKPQTYMNESGRAVAAALHYYRLTPADLVVVCDDLDLPPGRLRIRGRGGSGGHNGLKSIISALASEDFPRIRIGLGRPPEGWDAADFVLAPFTPEERGEVNRAISEAAGALEVILTQGLEQAMNLYNRTP